jgi:hydrogenase maturation protease
VVPVPPSDFERPGGDPAVVIGVGNEFRRDDGAGPAVVARLRDLAPPGVELVTMDGEPTRLIEAWTGAALAVVVDAVRAEPPQPGTVHRFVVDRPGATGPGLRARRARMASALMTGSAWPWSWTGCQPA